MATDWTAEGYFMQYHDNETNAHKFYHVYVLTNDTLGDYRVLYQWGRIGTNGSTNFKMCSSQMQAVSLAQKRVAQKLAKGYEHDEGWKALTESQLAGLLPSTGVNIHHSTERNASDGVSFDEMATLVDDVLKKSTGVEKPDVEVLVEAAQMNAKFATLREQFEQVESTVEFVNTAVRSRL